MEKIFWHNLEIKQALKKLNSNPKGLEKQQVQKRLKKYGLNKLLKRKRFSILQIIIGQFKSPLMYILIIAALIALILKETTDTIIILGAVFINAFIGFFQEFKAEETFSHLQKMVHHKTRVIRKLNTGTSATLTIASQQVVPGDIISLQAGDIISADARILKENNLETKEAALTGESIPSSKNNKVLDKETNLADRENMVYAGTLVTRGSGKAIVVSTGKNTEVGKIAHLLKTTKNDKTPLQEKISKLAKTLGIIIGILSLSLFVIGLILGMEVFEILLISIAVAVAGIPEGLPIAVTVALAVGMQFILKKKALVKKLIATETLGSITVIASDKTGTLTKGEMAVSNIITFQDNILEKDILKMAMLCNDANLENPDEKDNKKWSLTGDPTEVALLRKAIKSITGFRDILNNNERISEIPFESEIMYMATLYKNKNEQNYDLIVKGAPETLINLSNLDEAKKKEILDKVTNLTKKGLRVLAFAQKRVNINEKGIKINNKDINNLDFKGLISLKDPLRSDAKDTIDACIKAGIRPIIITGDHKLTAQSIGKEIGLIHSSSEVLEGNQIDKLSDKELSKELKNTSIFARVEPKHKIRIVDILQEQGEVVAMAGDGVNDAPALKSANIGIALGSGSEVTKGTAEIVLLDDRFQTIVDAIKQGRNIFHNIKKIILYLLTDTFTEFILIAGSLILGFPLPLIAAQILWVNIIEDTMPAIALSYEKEKKDFLLKQSKDDKKQKLLDKEMKFLITIIAIITNIVLLGLYYYLYKSGFDIKYVRTMIFVGLGIDTLFYVFSCKNLKKSIWTYNPFDNMFLNFSVLFGWAMFFIALYVPFFSNLLETVALGLSEWLILIGLGLFKLVLIEVGKLFFLDQK
ncbi:MAG TPA: HAD-IC family P-type ATPase [Patescibacteria group bacterium]|nr:HAD-IC family P-type ATPase [Patescibacteria group bacterium]